MSSTGPMADSVDGQTTRPAQSSHGQRNRLTRSVVCIQLLPASPTPAASLPPTILTT